MKKQKRVNICVNRLKYEWFARTRIDTYTNQLLVAWFLRLAMKGDSFTACRWEDSQKRTFGEDIQGGAPTVIRWYVKDSNI